MQACTKPIRFQNASVNLANREILPSLSPVSIKGTHGRTRRITDFRIRPWMSNEIIVGYVDGSVRLFRYNNSKKSIDDTISIYPSNSSEVSSVRTGPNDCFAFTLLGNAADAGSLYVGHGAMPVVYQVPLNRRTSIWTSSMSHNTSLIALGSSRSVIVVSGLDDGNAQNLMDIKTSSDVFVTHADYNESSSILYGCRDGLVRLFDLRSRRSRCGFKFHLSSSVCHIEQIGSWYLLTSAMNGSLELWDPRYISIPVIKFNDHPDCDQDGNSSTVDVNEDLSR
ncbi:3991_t:CDS:10 [Paraglomus occultum]|uniref:3991_t:CDS:1 n=1 Tax=Paraglomus occultum TaxID=144539 RepID=A0A9N9G0C1_9GLOM|nr:3991_t:CDS:10 [Paraglomus occultum]